VRRESVDGALDRLRLRLDLFPYRAYQPLPWLGLHSATRAHGSESRLAAIKPVVERVGARSVLDLGSNLGWFCLSLASAGIAVVGVESDPSAYRTALLAARKSGLPNVGFLVMEIRPETVDLLPAADGTLMLSIWHHWVRAYGVDVADEIVRSIWARTRKVLLFDTGENEMPASWGLPQMKPTAKEWLAEYLKRTCAGCTVEHLGAHAAFTAEGLPCERNLFAAVRRTGDGDQPSAS
jgi:SAM-dependent methyltransferase